MAHNHEIPPPVYKSPYVDDFEDTLKKLADEIREEHALLVKCQLSDAKLRRTEIQKDLPDFRDEQSPFRNLKPIEKALDEGQQFVEVKHLFSRLSVKFKIRVPFSCINTPVERLPRFKHYITLDRSILVGDARRLAYEPYLGDVGEGDDAVNLAFIHDYRAAYGGAKSPESSRKAEYASRINKHLPRILEEANVTKEELLTTMPKYSTQKWINAFENIFDVSLQQVFEDDAKDSERKAQKASPKSVRTHSSKKILETYLNLGCSICGVHECGMHGEYESNDTGEVNENGNKPLTTYERFNMSFESMMSRRDEKIGRNVLSRALQTEHDEPCSIECCLLQEVEDSFENDDTWTEEDVTYLKALLLILSMEQVSYCSIARALGKPCRQVRRMVLTKCSRPTTPQSLIEDERKRLNWYNNKTKWINTERDWGHDTRTHLHDQRGQPRGCEHPGRSCSELGEDCPCIRSKIMCEKFCACPGDCYLKHTGCNCNQSCSMSNTCPCWLLNRECDPDLCHFNNKSDGARHICGNVRIQRGLGKSLAVGESSHKVMGYGAYLLEPADKGDYLAEYVGEIISHFEADRRGMVYDKVGSSYLFDLNGELTIDAWRYGNTSRFINHSAKNANCVAKILLVNGEHRIGFFATKNIAAGQELFFDYGQKFANKHGLRDYGESPPTRGRGGRSRGGGRGRGRGGGQKRGLAASKFAPATPPAMEEQEQHVDPEAEEAVPEDEEMLDVFAASLPPERTDTSDDYEEEFDDDGFAIGTPTRRSGRATKHKGRYTR